ncbi:MAG: tRNA uridine-5-carboxymethylaminomethyl(34) synthesis GTPase MnmE, partial [Bacteroidetes bacterium]|nr:tRNA uridine-5-carboxymethylaminomethyl(34) synthesis GTPase MnmE [Bacteroidota bacterium]
MTTLSQIEDTICALATPPGLSAIGVIRVSGTQTFAVIEKFFVPRNKQTRILQAEGNTIHLGDFIMDGEVLDEVLVSVFKRPHSYTGEDSVEISCHGSSYIEQKILETIINNGPRLAKPGEFTLRAFLNGKFDLSQAEAVADLIASHSKASHDLALNQMRGIYSNKIKDLRKRLLDFASLIELELDFSGEDVEFADRDDLNKLLSEMSVEISGMIKSFSIGNVLKKGIPVAIIGEPNVGKSTLLNAILNEDRAIVSEIPGTTRDTIEDTIVINGISFRFIDTAGLREAGDAIESIGIERTFQKIDQAKIILYVFDVSVTEFDEIGQAIEELREHFSHLPEDILKGKKTVLIANKTDLLVEAPRGFKSLVEMECLFVSAKRKENINLILDSLSKYVETEKVSDNAIVSSARHYESLVKTLESLNNIRSGFF